MPTPLIIRLPRTRPPASPSNSRALLVLGTVAHTTVAKPSQAKPAHSTSSAAAAAPAPSPSPASTITSSAFSPPCPPAPPLAPSAFFLASSSAFRASSAAFLAASSCAFLAAAACSCAARRASSSSCRLSLKRWIMGPAEPRSSSSLAMYCALVASSPSS